MSDFLGERPFVGGKDLTFADFSVYDVLYQLNLFTPEHFGQFANLKAYLERIEALPAIKAFNASERAIRWPLTGPMAQWGTIKMECPAQK